MDEAQKASKEWFKKWLENDDKIIIVDVDRSVIVYKRPDEPTWRGIFEEGYRAVLRYLKAGNTLVGSIGRVDG